MKLNYITIVVENLEKSVEFYTELAELKIIRKINLPNGKIVFLANNEGETILELAEVESAESVDTKSLTISFLAENLEEVHKKASELNYNPTEILNHPPKPKHFQLNDPDGIRIEFS